MQPDISVKHLNKVYADGFQALKDINLDITRGEIFALLGPNGAGKTTLISIICGIVNKSSGEVKAAGYDIVHDYRKARETIGLVPQELTVEPFAKVFATVKFSRGVFGKARDAYEKALELDPSNNLIQQNYDLFREINDRINESDR